MRFVQYFIKTILLLLLIASISPASTSTVDIQLNVKEFQLENGMLFLVVERPATPQVAARLAIRAGSALEETGRTGIAHLLEHMMFKGTKNFGTLDVAKDAKLQQQIEAAYQSILNEQQKRSPDQKRIRQKRAEMQKLRAEVQKMYVPQAFSSQLGKIGAVGVNAFTTKDQTQYITSVPSDMLEQWFSMVSEQIFEPSWREFYVEKEVVQREWAFRYINDPGGAAWLDLNATAYSAHPYRNPTIGWKSDMEKYSTQDAIEFHQKYYNPANAVCVLVGDVTVAQAKQLAKTYFARYPAGQNAAETVTREPPQQGPRKNIRYLKGARTPLVRIGYHSTRMGTADFYALDAMIMVLSHGRGARMTQNIVNQGLAVEAWAYNPDNRYGGMLIVGGSPNEPEALKKSSGQPGEDEQRKAYLAACEKLAALLVAEVEKFKTEAVSARELARINLLHGLANQLGGSLGGRQGAHGRVPLFRLLEGHLAQPRRGAVALDDLRILLRKQAVYVVVDMVEDIVVWLDHVPAPYWSEVFAFQPRFQVSANAGQGVVHVRADGGFAAIDHAGNLGIGKAVPVLQNHDRPLLRG